MTDRVAIYPGSFDPPTNGHVDIVERSARLFDRVVVGVGRNLAKKTVFTADERIELMREACAKYPNVEVRAFDGLQVEFARTCGASFIVRGIRSPARSRWSTS
jgi:pantetheine-phosphate adenylyltransferase